MKIPLLLILISLLISTISAENIGKQKILEKAHYQKDLNNKNITELNIHLFPHTHFDVGKLKTIDEYLLGYNLTASEEKQGNATQVLNSIVVELLSNDDYQFAWAEQALFTRWYLMQNDNAKEAIKYLINTKQLTFVGGGWVVNDEACTYYEDIIDQQTLGHQFLDSYLGFKPSIGWSLDPYGHSMSQAWIYSQMGMEGMMLSRLDYQEQLAVMHDKKMQFIWPLPHNRILFSQILFYRFVEPEPYLYDYMYNKEEYKQFRETQEFTMPSKEKAMEFASYLRNISNHYKSDEFLYQIGNDYTFQDSQFSFEAYSHYLHLINDEKSMHTNIKYSKPDQYLKTLHKKEKKFNEYKLNDDFFPYRDDKNSYFTGYFTSKPFIKKLARDSGRLLQKFRNHLNLYILNGLSLNHTMIEFEHIQKDLLNFEQEVALLQHRDGITGTSKDSVLQDNIERILSSRSTVFNHIQDLIKQEFKNKLQNIENNDKNNIIFEWCKNDLFKNIECQVEDKQQNMIFSVYNYRHFATQRIIKFKGFKGLENYSILEAFTRKPVKAEMICKMVWDENEENDSEQKEECFVHFEAELEGLKSNYYLLVQGTSENNIKLIEKSKQSDSVQVNHKYMEQQFKFECLTKKIELKYIRNGDIVNFYLDYQTYNYNREQMKGDVNSGAHIFTVYSEQSKSELFENFECENIESYQGDLVSCMIFRGNEINTEFCLQKYEEFLNIRTDLKKQRKKTMDIVLNIYTNRIKNEHTFYTDSNGLFRMKRNLFKSSYRMYKTKDEEQDRIAQNFYPISKFISIAEKETSLTIFTDRSQGGTSLHKGTIQLMIFRQSLENDNRGLDEPLIDQQRYVIDHQMIFDMKNKDKEREIQLRQDLSEEIYHSYLNQEQFENLQKEFENKEIDHNNDNDDKSKIILGDIQSLEEKIVGNLDNKAKYTLKYIRDNFFILRVQNMMDKAHITVDLRKSFEIYSKEKYRIQVIEETNIQGTRTTKEIEQENITFEPIGDKRKKFKNHLDTDFSNVNIQPLDIRTFRIQVLNNGYIDRNKADISKEIWKRTEKPMQEFCQSDCYEHGVCVWDQCHCLKFNDRDCNYKCIDNCVFCITGDSCTICEEGYIKQKITPFIHHTDEEFNYQCVADTGFFTFKKMVFIMIFIVLIVVLGIFYVKYFMDEEKERAKFVQMTNQQQDTTHHQNTSHMIEESTMRKDRQSQSHDQHENHDHHDHVHH